MKVISNSSFEIWENNPISAHKRRFNISMSNCNCDCNWDGDGNDSLACTGSISN